MYNKFLRVTKNVIGVISLIYFFLPLVVRFLVMKFHYSSDPSIVVKILTAPIFQPVLQQYDIALAKNSPIYYLAFLVCLLLICWACWLIVFYVFKMFYLMFKR